MDNTSSPCGSKVDLAPGGKVWSSRADIPREVNIRNIIEPLLLAVQNKLDPGQPVTDNDIIRFVDNRVFNEDDGWTTGGENFYPDEAECTRSAASVGHPIGTLAESAIASGSELKQIPTSKPRNKVTAARIKKTTPKSQKAHRRAGATVFLAIMENNGRSNSLSLSWRDAKNEFLGMGSSARTSR